MTLLVVDPDDASSSALSDKLSHLGFNVARISGVDALRSAVEKSRPELVLCPYRATDVHPFALAEAIHAADPSLPLALVTGQTLETAFVVRALRLGVTDVLEIGDSRLLPLIDAAIGRGSRLAAGERDMASAQAQLRELQRDQRAGRYIQMGMLPPSPMAIDRYRLKHKLYPSLLLSGDFVDYFRITDRHFAFYMADVSGHGASSAFVTVLLKNFSRRLRREYRPKMLRQPGDILAALNRELLDNQLDKHVAIFIGVVDLADDTLAFANGGHFPAAILSDASGCRFLESSGKPVGLFEGVTWTSNQVDLDGPLAIALVSDGVLEMLDGTALTDKEQQLLQAVQRMQRDGGELWQVLELEQQGPGPDDMACLVISRAA
jgi:phosphoserine phosphatase RsbU/P